MKGSKRNRWAKDGEKTSRKWLKHVWNKKIRHKKLYDNCYYKRYAGVSMWIGIP